MSTWCRLESTAPDHPKVAKLARKLGVEPVVAFGHLSSLWARVCAAAPDGDLTSYDADDLSVFASWRGDAEQLVEGLLGARLIDEVRDDDGTLLGYALHDWMERAEGHRRATAARARREAERAAEAAARRARDHDASLRVTDASGTRSRREPPRNRRDHARGEDREDRDPPATQERRLAPLADPPVPPLDEPPDAPDAPVAASPPEALSLLPPEPDTTPERVLALWREVCGPAGLPVPRKLTDELRRKVAARRRELRTPDDWRRYLERIAGSAFCRGEIERNGRRWRATLRWALRSDDVVQGVLDGDYDDRAGPAPAGGTAAQRADVWAELLDAIRRTPSGEPLRIPSVPDEVMRRALGALGGRRAIGHAHPSQHPRLRAQFFAELAAARAGGGARAPASAEGLAGSPLELGGAR